MADEKPEKPPAAPPPPPKPRLEEPRVAPKAAPQGTKITPKAPEGKAGFDVTRPFRYLKGFIVGTVTSTLDNTSNWGRRAMKIGAVVGLGLALAPIALPALITGVTTASVTASLAGVGLAGFNLLTGPLFMGAMGLVGGAIGGAVVGVATGGIAGMAQVGRGEKYAEDVVVKEKAKSSPVAKRANEVDYREAYREQQRQNNFVQNVLEQQEDNQERDSGSYWQDMVSGSHSSSRSV